MNPEKAVGQNAAVEESPQFPFNESRDRTILFPLPGQKCLQVLGYNSVEEIILRIAGTIFGGRVGNEATFLPCLKTDIVRYVQANGRTRGHFIAALL
jgi:hypothetical protein